MMTLPSPSVLITDDDAAFRETLGGVLEPLGVRTLLAANGEEALGIVRREEVHLVLLDMHMPRLTGLETLRRLRQFKAFLPCILMSARLDERIVDEAQREHAFLIMAKPVTRQQITGAVDRALRTAYNWQGPARTLRITIRGEVVMRPPRRPDRGDSEV